MTVHTVSQVVRYLRSVLLSDPLLNDVWVRGEASNCTTSQAGHTYFTLKDAECQLRCVMFKGGQGCQHLTDGAALTVHGHVSLYEARGMLQMVADIAIPEGVGVLQAQFEALKKKLGAEGLFDPSRKRPLPQFPQVIGVVTSPIGAVVHDICHVLARRYPLARVLVAGTRVQGDGAAQSIVQALEELNRRDDVDVIILARGGGSLEELWPFNEESVARAIYASKVPVVSGVGHETDFTIADFVADVRAPTPSAAAEIVAPSVDVLRDQVGTLQARLRQHLSDIVAEHRHGLTSLRQRLWFHVPDVEEHKRRLDDLCQSINMALSRQTSLLHERCESLTRRLEAMNPADTLRRGYAIVQRHRDQAIVSRVGQVQAGEALKVTVSNGDFPATAGGEPKPRRRRKKAETYVARPLF